MYLFYSTLAGNWLLNEECTPSDDICDAEIKISDLNGEPLPVGARTWGIADGYGGWVEDKQVTVKLLVRFQPPILDGLVNKPPHSTVCCAGGNAVTFRCAIP